MTNLKTMNHYVKYIFENLNEFYRYRFPFGIIGNFAGVNSRKFKDRKRQPRQVEVQPVQRTTSMKVMK